MEKTVDHAEIREWAKARGVVPRRHGQDLSFTDGVQISWREWFELRRQRSAAELRRDQQHTTQPGVQPRLTNAFPRCLCSDERERTRSTPREGGRVKSVLRDSDLSVYPRQPAKADPGAHVEWVPLLIRSGSVTRATGPAATFAASKTRAWDRFSGTSMVKVTR